MPQSTSTIPSPARQRPGVAVRHAGQGSGSRRRQTPGSTRSPRPVSVRRVGLRMAATLTCRAWPPTPGRSPQTYFARARPRATSTATAACWAPDGVDNILGQAEAHGPDGVRTFFAELFDAVPDFAFEVDDVLADGDRAAVLWHADGTFAGDAAYQGIAPTGGRVALTGLDLMRVRDGLIVRNDGFPDGLGFARQIGMLPRAGVGRGGQGAARVQRPHARGAQPRRQRRGAGRRRRLARPRRRPARDERVPDRGRRRRRHGLRRGRQEHDRRDRGRRQRARRDQPRRARPRARRPPRRRAGPRRAGALPPRRPRTTPRATAACTTSTSRS